MMYGTIGIYACMNEVVGDVNVPRCSSQGCIVENPASFLHC